MGWRGWPAALAIATTLLTTACAGGSRGGPEAPTPEELAGQMAQVSAPAPAGPRAITPFDLLQVTVLDAPEFTREVRVSESGEISLPLVGLFPAAGRSPHELEVALADRLRGSYMVDPQVTVSVTEAAPEPVYVVGEVQQPGAFTAMGSNRLTVLQAVAMARGLKPTASKKKAFVIRTYANGGRGQIPVAYSDVVNGKAPDMVLEPNDVVYVPSSRTRAVALGLVDTLVRVVTFRAVF